MKNKFEKPEMLIIYFYNEDIITESVEGLGAGLYGDNGDDWQDPADI